VLLALALSALLVLSLACGGDDDDDDGGDDNGASATETDDGNGGNGGGEETFDVSMGDNFFEPNEFTVAPGSTLTFNLTNDGTAIHNMRIFGEDNESGNDDDAVSDPDLVMAGESATLEWTAPDEPGVYDFYCDYHTTDMTGTITVE
jgi:plastocyanin